MALSKITTASLSDNAVTTAKITDANITTAKVADDAITTAKVNPAQTDITSVGTLSSATISGDLTVDTNTLKIDATNNKVGILQASPQDEFHVKGFARIEAEAGNAPYIRYDNTANSGGVMWRAGSASGHTNWDIYNQTDNKFIATFHKDGFVTMPNQSAFCATMSANQNNLSANGANHIIQFNTERFDQNADFNDSTHTFTAPVTGRYQLNLYIRSDQLDQDTDHYRVRIDTSNRTYDVRIIDPTSYDIDVRFHGNAGSVLADMDAGDTAIAKFFNHGTGNAQVDLSEGHFSGYLVC